jgi:hypothetical protein
MSFFSWLRDKTPSPRAERAQSLAGAADANAVSSFVHTLDHFPSLRSVDPKRWDKVLIVAGIFVGVSRLNQEQIDESERSSLFGIVTKEAIRRDPKIVEAIDDCRVFVDRTYDALSKGPNYETNQQFLFSDALGGWIVWNLFGHAPETEEEGRMVRVIGATVTHTFYSWWQV